MLTFYVIHLLISNYVCISIVIIILITSHSELKKREVRQLVLPLILEGKNG